MWKKDVRAMFVTGLRTCSEVMRYFIRVLGFASNLLLPSMNNVDAERVNRVSAHIVAINARDEYLAFMIIDEEAADHREGI